MKKGRLKRPGSPNMSESSDNEAARKKLKTGKTSVIPSRGATPLPGRPKPMAGPAMSDGEATAGEASDAGVKLKKKLKLKPGVRTGGTPAGSRAGSPAPGNSPPLAFRTAPVLTPQPATQASATGTATPSGSPPPGSPTNPTGDRIQSQEIADAIAPYAQEGISLSNLLRMFQKRINKPGNVTKSEWLQMVKAHAVFGPVDKLLRPKPVRNSP